MASAYVVTSARCLHSYTEADIQVNVMKIVENLVGFSFSREMFSRYYRNLQCPHLKSMMIEMTLLYCLVPSPTDFYCESLSLRGHDNHLIAMFRLLSISSKIMKMIQPIALYCIANSADNTYLVTPLQIEIIG